MKRTNARLEKNRAMFWRLLLRSLSVRHPQAVLGVGSLAVGAAVTAMLFNLYGDARRKMAHEFRAYGANVLLAPAPIKSGLDAAASSTLGSFIPEDALSRLESMQKWTPGLAAAPMLYVVVRLAPAPGDRHQPEFQNAVAVGTDFLALRRLFPSWQVDGASSALGPDACAVGAHIAARLRLGPGDRLELETLSQGVGEAQRQEFRVSASVTTGSSEDDQVFLPLLSLQRLAGLEGKISLAELRVPGRAEEVEGAVRGLAQVFPDIEVRPIRQIVYSEGRIVGTIGTLIASLTLLILAIIALCVAATMTAIMLERRRDIAVMKALGASDRAVLFLFLGEAASLGLVGGAAGFTLGGLLAHHLSQRLFGVALPMVWWSLPVVCFSSVLVALAATSFPVRIIGGVQPATVLKAE